MVKGFIIAVGLALSIGYAEDLPFDLAQMEMPEAPEGIDFSAELRRISMTLGAIIILGALTIFVIKRLTRQRQARFNNLSKIHIIEQRSLSPKAMAYLLEVDGKKLFFVESAQGTTALALDERVSPRSFHELLDEEPAT